MSPTDTAADAAEATETHRVPRAGRPARKAPPRRAMPSRGRPANPDTAAPAEAVTPGAPPAARLTRRSRKSGSADEFAVPAHLKKPGWDYQWWTHRVLGQEQSTTKQYEGAWQTCNDKAIMAHFCPPGWDKRFIEKDGQVLYMRPLYLTKEAQDEDYDIATTQVGEKIKATLADTAGLPRSMPRKVQAFEMTAEIGVHQQKSAGEK